MNYFNYNANCGTNKKVEETSFVSHIIYASTCSTLYFSEILLIDNGNDDGSNDNVAEQTKDKMKSLCFIQ